MTDDTPERRPAVDGFEGLTDEVLPALIARLRASRLGELEVRTDDWHVRLRRDPNAAKRSAVPVHGCARMQG